MPIPTYEEFMLPLLRFVGDGKEHHIRDVANAIAEELEISQIERDKMIPSGTKTVYYDRAQWAKTYLKKAGLIESVGRGTFRITNRGIDVLNSNPARIDSSYLLQFAEFVEFKNTRRDNVAISQSSNQFNDATEKTPEEVIDSVLDEIQKSLIEELLDYILSSSPAFFEKLVVDLLQAMGYGGAFGTGKAIGRTDDGGIDGYIEEDKLGLDTIYIQAKRWQQSSSVGRPEVQAFVGSLMGAGASKGVFITTSRFSQKAYDYVQTLKTVKLILIDGEKLAKLMIEHNVGVGIERSFSLKRVDRDYFEVI